jgi:hypothetical protein|tara:strand:- start:178 stop:549 length:372 start_codon:yes stop_codon:yes gene_type:complete
MHVIKTEGFYTQLSPIRDNKLVSGCGLSRKTNKRANSKFLYFWYYQDGKKFEKYLGRVDDEKANLKGAHEMLAFYRNQDEELHQMIEKLETQTVNNSSHKSSIHTIHLPITEKKPNYLPDFED